MWDITVKIGGEAGQGLQSVGALLGKYFARRGYYVFTNQDNESRIRGGHNFFQVRVSTYPVQALADKVDLLVALDRSTVELHGSELASGGIILADAGNAGIVADGGGILELSFTGLALEHGGNKIYLNAAATAAILACTGQPLEPLEELLLEVFHRKPDAAKSNVRVARSAYILAQDRGKLLEIAPPPVQAGARLFLNGHEALCLGALAAGCQFMAAYPMSPSSSIITFLAEQAEKLGLVVEQAEDEIAAMNMVLGASYAGVRAMTATSGGGFSLMVEALGLAGMTETPAVVVNAQRPGPATGLPTRTEQADLGFVIHAAQGEFPRFVLAPRTIGEAFYLTARAFDLAERFQIPVIILTDQHLAESYTAVESFDFSKTEFRHYIKRDALPGYRRYLFTDDDISPRALPGTPGITVALDSDEHNQEGHIIEDAETRRRMMEKRMGKLQALAGLAMPPEVFGSEEASWVLVGWGSTCEALREACRKLMEQGLSVQARFFSELWPLPPGILDPWPAKAKLVAVEGNYTGQFSQLLTTASGRRADYLIRRYDGRPITPGYIIDALQKITEEVGKHA